jgi:hypothetical protein
MKSLLRVLVTAAILAGILLAGYWRLTYDQQQKAIDELASMNKQMHEQLAQRQAMITRLSRSRRIAHVKILDQVKDGAQKTASTEILFIELNDQGSELGHQSFTIPGDVLFVDAWTVKFDPQRVAEGDPFQGKTLVLLRRIYSDLLPPAKGIPIDTPGAIPPGYAASDVGKFEQRLWQNFWDIATDAEQARRMGVRVAQGEAVYKPVRTGQTFELLVDAVGGMSLTPIDPKASDAALTKVGD